MKTIKKELHNIETLICCLLEQVNEDATEGTDWSHQVLVQADIHGVTQSFRTVYSKPYYNQHGKQAWSETDGYTVSFPAFKLSYHDKRTEYRFKQNDCKLENCLYRVFEKMNEIMGASK